MKKVIPAANPDAYVASFSGWRQDLVISLRATVRRTHDFDEVIRWGHLVYFADDAPVLLIRAEDARVLFGFLRGQRLRDIEPRLKPGGMYEMATLDLREGDTISAATVRKLVTKAVALNEAEGDPRLQAKPKPKPKGKRTRRV